MFRCVALFLSLLATIAPAQEVTGSISGAVTDPTGSAISGATVRLINEQTAASRTVESDAEGNFTFAAVLPGMYTVTAEHAGFKKFQKQQIELTPGGKIGVGALQLPVDSVSESVTVLSEGKMVQTATSERAGIVTSE